MIKYPWKELKEAEIILTDYLALGTSAPPKMITQLRRFLVDCMKDPDADYAICFHGAKACLAQIDGDTELAIHHREIEEQKIVQLYEEEKTNPTNGGALVNYLEEDIIKRRSIIKKLKKNGA